LWAERFDRETTDLFALQNEITSRIAIGLNVELTNREAGRPIEQPDVLDYILRGCAAWAKGGSRENIAEAIRLYERALVLDPRSVEAQSRLASVLVIRGLNAAPDAARADFGRAEGLINDALAASPRYPRLISPKVSCCGLSADAKRPSLNSRWSWRRIATRWARSPI
jgi:hypothetical protein